MIEARKLSKRYGGKLAVDGLSFTVEPGKVTGFLGPNGAGKSTTMRLLLGLDRPDAGRPASAARPTGIWPCRCAPSARCWRRGRRTRAAAPTTTCSAWPRPRACRAGRVDEVIALTGLTSVARKRAGGFSLGMGQRLGIAAALLGDPEVLLLDEPVNGLDPEGVIWVRNLMKHLAAEGRTVFVSSHLMNEMSRHR